MFTWFDYFIWGWSRLSLVRIPAVASEKPDQVFFNFKLTSKDNTNEKATKTHYFGEWFLFLLCFLFAHNSHVLNICASAFWFCIYCASTSSVVLHPPLFPAILHPLPVGSIWIHTHSHTQFWVCVCVSVSKRNLVLTTWFEQSETRNQRVLHPGLPDATTTAAGAPETAEALKAP